MCGHLSLVKWKPTKLLFYHSGYFRTSLSGRRELLRFPPIIRIRLDFRPRSKGNKRNLVSSLPLWLFPDFFHRSEEINWNFHPWSGHIRIFIESQRKPSKIVIVLLRTTFAGLKELIDIYTGNPYTSRHSFLVKGRTTKLLLYHSG